MSKIPPPRPIDGDGGAPRTQQGVHQRSGDGGNVSSKELNSLLQAVQGSLSDLRTEVASARKLSAGPSLGGGPSGSTGLAPPQRTTAYAAPLAGTASAASVAAARPFCAITSSTAAPLGQPPAASSAGAATTTWQSIATSQAARAAAAGGGSGGGGGGGGSRRAATVDVLPSAAAAAAAASLGAPGTAHAVTPNMPLGAHAVSAAVAAARRTADAVPSSQRTAATDALVVRHSGSFGSGGGGGGASGVAPRTASAGGLRPASTYPLASGGVSGSAASFPVASEALVFLCMVKAEAAEKAAEQMRSDIAAVTALVAPGGEADTWEARLGGVVGTAAGLAARADASVALADAHSSKLHAHATQLHSLSSVLNQATLTMDEARALSASQTAGVLSRLSALEAASSVSAAASAASNERVAQLEAAAVAASRAGEESERRAAEREAELQAGFDARVGELRGRIAELEAAAAAAAVTSAGAKPRASFSLGEDEDTLEDVALKVHSNSAHVRALSDRVSVVESYLNADSTMDSAAKAARFEVTEEFARDALRGVDELREWQEQTQRGVHPSPDSGAAGPGAAAAAVAATADAARVAAAAHRLAEDTMRSFGELVEWLEPELGMIRDRQQETEDLVNGGAGTAAAAGSGASAGSAPLRTLPRISAVDNSGDPGSNAEQGGAGHHHGGGAAFGVQALGDRLESELAGLRGQVHQQEVLLEQVVQQLRAVSVSASDNASAPPPGRRSPTKDARRSVVFEGEAGDAGDGAFDVSPTSDPASLNLARNLSRNPSAAPDASHLSKRVSFRLLPTDGDEDGEEAWHVGGDTEAMHEMLTQAATRALPPALRSGPFSTRALSRSDSGQSPLAANAARRSHAQRRSGDDGSEGDGGWGEASSADGAHGSTSRRSHQRHSETGDSTGEELVAESRALSRCNTANVLSSRLRPLEDSDDGGGASNSGRRLSRSATWRTSDMDDSEVNSMAWQQAGSVSRDAPAGAAAFEARLAALEAGLMKLQRATGSSGVLMLSSSPPSAFAAASGNNGSRGGGGGGGGGKDIRESATDARIAALEERAGEVEEALRRAPHSDAAAGAAAGAAASAALRPHLAALAARVAAAEAGARAATADATAALRPQLAALEARVEDGARAAAAAAALAAQLGALEARVAAAEDGARVGTDALELARTLSVRQDEADEAPQPAVSHAQTALDSVAVLQGEVVNLRAAIDRHVHDQSAVLEQQTAALAAHKVAAGAHLERQVASLMGALRDHQAVTQRTLEGERAHTDGVLRVHGDEQAAAVSELLEAGLHNAEARHAALGAVVFSLQRDVVDQREAMGTLEVELCAAALSTRRDAERALRALAARVDALSAGDAPRSGLSAGDTLALLVDDDAARSAMPPPPPPPSRGDASSGSDPTTAADRAALRASSSGSARAGDDALLRRSVTETAQLYEQVITSGSAGAGATDRAAAEEAPSPRRASLTPSESLTRSVDATAATTAAPGAAEGSLGAAAVAPEAVSVAESGGGGVQEEDAQLGAAAPAAQAALPPALGAAAARGAPGPQQQQPQLPTPTAGAVPPARASRDGSVGALAEQQQQQREEEGQHGEMGGVGQQEQGQRGDAAAEDTSHRMASRPSSHSLDVGEDTTPYGFDAVPASRGVLGVQEDQDDALASYGVDVEDGDASPHGDAVLASYRVDVDDGGASPHGDAGGDGLGNHNEPASHGLDVDDGDASPFWHDGADGGDRLSDNGDVSAGHGEDAADDGDASPFWHDGADGGAGHSGDELDVGDLVGSGGGDDDSGNGGDALSIGSLSSAGDGVYGTYDAGGSGAGAKDEVPAWAAEGLATQRAATPLRAAAAAARSDDMEHSEEEEEAEGRGAMAEQQPVGHDNGDCDGDGDDALSIGSLSSAGDGVYRVYDAGSGGAGAKDEVPAWAAEGLATQRATPERAAAAARSDDMEHSEEEEAEGRGAITEHQSVRHDGDGDGDDALSIGSLSSAGDGVYGAYDAGGGGAEGKDEVSAWAAEGLATQRAATPVRAAACSDDMEDSEEEESEVRGAMVEHQAVGHDGGDDDGNGDDALSIGSLSSAGDGVYGAYDAGGGGGDGAAKGEVPAWAAEGLAAQRGATPGRAAAARSDDMDKSEEEENVGGYMVTGQPAQRAAAPSRRPIEGPPRPAADDDESDDGNDAQSISSSLSSAGDGAFGGYDAGGGDGGKTGADSGGVPSWVAEGLAAQRAGKLSSTSGGRAGFGDESFDVDSDSDSEPSGARAAPAVVPASGLVQAAAPAAGGMRVNPLFGGGAAGAAAAASPGAASTTSSFDWAGQDTPAPSGARGAGGGGLGRGGGRGVGASLSLSPIQGSARSPEGANSAQGGGGDGGWKVYGGLQDE
ncbi:hypothetical protein FOA52_001751 [Chlamydomonas sp. UWO 241]|nr:hypothetical protein FOA52_001751 [Chlamydomonas sp. UWO 241]